MVKPDFHFNISNSHAGHPTFDPTGQAKEVGEKLGKLLGYPGASASGKTQVLTIKSKGFSEMFLFSPLGAKPQISRIGKFIGPKRKTTPAHVQPGDTRSEGGSYSNILKPCSEIEPNWQPVDVGHWSSRPSARCAENHPQLITRKVGSSFSSLGLPWFTMVYHTANTSMTSEITVLLPHALLAKCSNWKGGPSVEATTAILQKRTC